MARKGVHDEMNEDDDVATLLEGGASRGPSGKPPHRRGRTPPPATGTTAAAGGTRSSNPARFRRLLQAGGFVAVVVSLLQLTGYALESTVGTFRFYTHLGGISSEAYCPDYVPLVRSYLDPYRNGSTSSPGNVQKVLDFMKQQERFSPLRIHGGSVIWPTNPGHDKRRHQDLKANVELAQTLFGYLPDVEVWFNPSDAPGMPRDLFPDPPVLPPPLAYFTTPRHRDLSIPYFKLEVWNEAEAVTTLDVLVDSHPWQEKVHRAVWRGSSTGQPEPDDQNFLTLPRARLVNISLHHPDLLDARLTSCKQCHGHVKERFKELGYGYAGFLSYEDMFHYTMLVDVDGNSWSSRFPQLLSINSATFKQETDNIEWFRPLLEPHVHYVPVREDLTDLVEQILDYSGRPRDLEVIAELSSDLYRKLLLPSKQLCYLHLLLKEYAAILPLSGMEKKAP